jgi:tetratricopeptide (TPR) repeat protein
MNIWYKSIEKLIDTNDYYELNYIHSYNLNEYDYPDLFYFKNIYQYNYDMCKNILQICGIMIYFVSTQTVELIEIALNENDDASHFIDLTVLHNHDDYDKSIELFKKILKRVPSKFFLIDFKYQSDDLCKLAVKYNKNNFFLIKNITIDLIKFSIKYHPSILAFVNQTDDLIKYAIELDPMNLQYVKNNLQTLEIIKLAIDKNPNAVSCIRNFYIELFKNIVETDEILECIICKDDKKYLASFQCHKNHVICLDCLKLYNTCYYRCNKNISLETLIKFF